MAENDPLLGHGRQIVVREDWLGLTEEPILEPGLPIVDPHHHLLERDGGHSYLLPQLLADTASGHDVRGLTAWMRPKSSYCPYFMRWSAFDSRLPKFP